MTLAVDAELLKLNTSKTSRKWILLSANPLSLYRIASLSNDGDVKENGKKALGLLNNNFARARFFVLISLQTLHDYHAKFPNFTFCGGRDHKIGSNRVFFFFSFFLCFLLFSSYLRLDTQIVWTGPRGNLCWLRAGLDTEITGGLGPRCRNLTSRLFHPF